MTGFDSVLVANRGEIALRVIRGVRAAGLRSIAVYSDADRTAPHVRAADEAVRIGPASATESYLSVSALLVACKRAGADAVHPGYGFLSESAEFARAVTEAGLVFIGPSADVIAAMGRKDAARQVAVEAGVPILAAVRLADGDLTGGEALPEIGRQIGFPLLVKAASGGGGRGMRIVHGAADLAEAVASARREAQAAFGDDTMLVERYVESGRHIEVQVLGDEQGHVVHLFERDCSVQRRHQKVIEEAPATMISSGVRDTVLSAAVALARQVGYTNAGTVEFLVSGEDAYFLEMNTRLQVEHPVTELVTGLDLVQLQLSVAQGLPLPFTQHDISVSGHALEARVYAEDPFHGFLPQAGVATQVQWPQEARVDAALESCQEVTTYYDPLLGKVIVAAASREAARRALVAALDDTAVLGLTTNVGFLRTLADSAAFRDGEVHTSWLDSHLGDLHRPVPEVAWFLAAWALATADLGTATGPLSGPDGWRLGGAPAGIPVSLASVDGGGADQEPRMLVVHPQEGMVQVDGRDIDVRQLRRGATRVGLEVDGRTEIGHVLVQPHRVLASYHGQTHEFIRPDAFGPTAQVHPHDGSIVAPMPGTVLVVDVAVGAEVTQGQTVAVMEAMKMELALKAPFAGTVASVAVTAGEQLALGAELLRVEPAAADSSEQPPGRQAGR